MRFLRPADSPVLIDFFNTHTEDTIRSRYGHWINQMSPERAARLVGVNQDWDAALGIFEGREPESHLVAVGRCCRLASGDAAEMAFVVREDKRRLGLATTLFHTLLSLMRSRGVCHFVAQVQLDNEAMLRLFRKAGAVFTSIPGTDSLDVRLEIGSG
jgi:ribosomal protein S18 acetylase RimI-like enzyme